MRLSKQERIATIVILVIVILCVGIFVFIKPAIDDLSAAQKNLDNKQAEYNSVVEKQGRKEGLRTQIEEAYKKGEDKANMFFSELTSYQADEAMRAFLEQCDANVIVEQLTVEEPGTSTLSPYFYAPEDVVYDLKTYATQGADVSEAEAKRTARLLELEQQLGAEQTIGSSVVSFDVAAIDRMELLKFADEVNSYIVKENNKDTRKAMILNGISFDVPEVEKYYSALVDKINADAEKAGRAALKEETGLEVEGAAQNDAGEGDTEGSGQTNTEEEKANVSEYIYTVSTSITFYTIERMQNPKAQLDAQDGVGA